MRFELHDDTIRHLLDEAGGLAASVALPAPSGEELSIAEMAALYYSQHGAESLRAAAIARRGSRAYELETFSPLYLTNTCDSECKMCGMRRENFARAADAGMRVVNPGVLLGLCRDLGYELVALALHVRHLLARGLEVYVSVPRLRQASGADNARGVSDDEFVRLVAVLSMGLPQAKIVVTTRECAEVQRRVLPMVTVLSAGSSAVTPYTEAGAHFPLEASQFEVIDQ